MELNNVILAGSVCMHPSVCLSQNVRLCTANKQLDLEEPFFTHVCLLTTYICQLIFIQIDNVLYLNFQAQRFELRMVTDRTNITIADTESHICPFDWHIYI